MSSETSSHEADFEYENRVRDSLPAHLWQMLKLGIYPIEDRDYQRHHLFGFWCQTESISTIQELSEAPHPEASDVVFTTSHASFRSKGRNLIEPNIGKKQRLSLKLSPVKKETEEDVPTDRKYFIAEITKGSLN